MSPTSWFELVAAVAELVVRGVETATYRTPAERAQRAADLRAEADEAEADGADGRARRLRARARRWADRASRG
jgi:hypothetical protein